jgi:poly(A) polymerase
VLDVLLPELSAYLADSDQDGVVFRLLSGVDRENQSRETALDDIVLWAILLLEPMREACSGVRDRIKAGQEFLEPIVDRLNMPRRIADAVRRIVAALPRLEAGRVGRVQRHALYPLARDVLALSQAAHGTARPEADAHDAPGKATRESSRPTSSAAPSKQLTAGDRPARRRRRRRPRRPRESSRDGE